MNKKLITIYLLAVVFAFSNCTKNQSVKPSATVVAPKPKHIDVVLVATGSFPQPSATLPVKNIVINSTGVVYGTRLSRADGRTSVFKYDNGHYTNLFTTPLSTSDEYGDSYDFYSITRLVIDSKDNVYYIYNRNERGGCIFCDYQSFSKVMRITPQGDTTQVAGGIAYGMESSDTTQFGLMDDIAIDKNDNIYTLDQGNHDDNTYKPIGPSVRKIMPDGHLARYISFAKGRQVSLAVDGEGNFYVSGAFEGGNVNYYTNARKYTATHDSIDFIKNLEVTVPMITDRSGNVWFGSGSGIYVYNAQGKVLGSGYNRVGASSIWFDKQGKVYLAGATAIYQCILR